MTLASDPKVLLLDEPMAGMSSEETQYTADLIREVTAGRALLLVEHDMDVVFALGDRISVLVARRDDRHRYAGRDPRSPGRARGLPRRGDCRRERRTAAPKALCLAGRAVARRDRRSGRPSPRRWAWSRGPHPPRGDRRAAPQGAIVSVVAQELLRIDDLHAHYGKSHILRGVSFNVRRGEVISLLGRNGSGRSTTLKAIMGLVPPTAGRIHLGARQLAGARPNTICRAGLAFVPEEREIFANLTVDENLRMGEQAPAPGAHRWTAQEMFDYFPQPQGAPRHQGWQPLRRRTTDAHHLPLSARQPARDPG